MQETVIETFDDVKFIEGVTKMNQKNWQDYFRHGFKNGVYEGLDVFIPDRNDSSSAESKIFDGTAFVNGLCVTISTDDGYTTFPKSSLTDRFICLRVYLKEQTAKLIVKTEISSDSSSSSVMAEAGKFFADESYCCERSELIYDLPLRYAGTENAGWDYLFSGFDLRRIIQTGKDTIADTSRVQQITKNNIYNLTALEQDQSYNEGTICCPDLINITDGAIISVTDGSSTHPFALAKFPYYGFGGYGLTQYAVYSDFNSPVTIEYKTTSNSWVQRSNAIEDIEWLFGNGKSTLVIKLHYLGYTPYSPSTPGRGTYTFFVEELES